MDVLKRILRFLSSMRFAIVLLVLLAGACMIGTVIPQLQSYDYYAARYSERAAMVLLVLYLDDVFHSWWFVCLTALLCVNLLACNSRRVKEIYAKFQSDNDLDKTALLPANVEIDNIDNINRWMDDLHFRIKKRAQLEDGSEVLLSTKNRIGHWGAWLCHLGMLLLIFGFALGQITAKQYTVAGFSGDSIKFADDEISVTIDGFTIDYNEDGSPRQYTSQITAQYGNETVSATAGVNAPAKVKGYLFSQNSYGYAAETRVIKKGECIQTATLFPQQAFALDERPDVTVYLDEIIPSENGYGAFIYSCYLMGGYRGAKEKQPIMENETQPLTGEYEISFAIKPYTVLVARRDFFRIPTLMGAIIVLAALIISFYFKPVKLLALKQADGLWKVKAYCRKGDAIFIDGLRSKSKMRDGEGGV